MYRLVDTQTDFLVIAKDPGVHVHGRDGDPGLVAQVREDRDEEVFLVHRLDTPTSGLMLLARTRAAAREFGSLFARREVDKLYVALSDRKARKKQGMVRGGMVKARRGAWKLTRGEENEALTRFTSASVEPGLRAYFLRPHSGRTHQLRVALKSLGAPILGDELYGGTPAARCYLHAVHLRFEWAGRACSYWQAPTHGERFLTPAFAERLAEQRTEGLAKA